MRSADGTPLIICEYCDCVYQRPVLAKHQKAHCQCCDAVIHRPDSLSVQQRLALSCTAAVLLFFCNVYPVMSIHLQGQEHSATLWDSILALSNGAITLIALVMCISVVLAPAVQTALLIWVLGFAQKRQRAPGFALCMRWLEALRPWSMLEVCLLGALVAVFKLAGFLNVVPGIGLLALASLSILMIKIAGRDVRQLWLAL
jgi:paraquat-inducible protein A